jgi:hypothetical protein
MGVEWAQELLNKTKKKKKPKQKYTTKFSNIKIEQFIQDTGYDLLILS